MQPFLKDAAHTIFKNYNTNLENILIVVPNRRAGQFLQRHLSSLAKCPIWSPEIQTISDFIKSLCPFEIESTPVLLAELYIAVSQIEKNRNDNFDNFLKWGQLMLSDFNEIDSYLIESNIFFDDLKNIKNIENWSLTSLNLSKTQKDLTNFWIKLGKYYKQFNLNLKSKNIGYHGMASRHVAENIEAISLNLIWNDIFFVGFNALSASEQLIVSFLTKKKKARLLWDIDSYYFRDKLNEAGLFFRRYEDLISGNLSDFLEKEEKSFEIIGVPQNIGQADVAFSIIKNIPKELVDNTLIVLTDESLITPLLNSCSSIIENLNITMGLSIKWSPVFDLLSNLISLIKNSSLKEGQSILFNTSDLDNVLSNGYIINHLSEYEQPSTLNDLINLLKNEPNQLIELKELIQPNSSSFLRNFMTNIGDLTSKKDSFGDFFDLLGKFISSIKLSCKKNLKNYETGFFNHITRSILEIKSILGQYESFLNFESFGQFLIQGISTHAAPILGNPNKGIQVMGMLETRALDFENVIILSANETILPKSKLDNTLIPFDIKKYYKLPTHVERDAIYANHFYRILQRAKKIYITYNTEKDEFGSGENSRFISQIISELPKKNPKVKINKYIFSTNINLNEDSNIFINKDNEILEKITRALKKGTSPTMISTFINCPLDFYYKYVLKLKEEEPKNQLSPPILGTCIHNALENSYLPYKKRIIRIKDLDDIKENTIRNYKKEIAQQINPKYLKSGHNYMVNELGKIYIKKFFSHEINFLKSLNSKGLELTILELENDLKEQYRFMLEEKAIDVTLIGKVDRIDKIGNTLRVIDYKTGSVQKNELSFAAMEDLFTPGTSLKAKALQVYLYGYLYYKTNQSQSQIIDPRLISMKNIKEGYQGLYFKQKPIENIKALFDDFEICLESFVKQLMDKETPFTHNTKSNKCAFCEH